MFFSRLPSSIFERFFHLKLEKMAAIPSSGSLIATHDYYRSKSNPLEWIMCFFLTEFNFWWHMSQPKLSFRTTRVQFQQQLLWQFWVHRGGYSTPSRFGNWLFFMFKKKNTCASSYSTIFFVSFSTSTARLRALVDFLFLYKTKPGKWIRQSKVSWSRHLDSFWIFWFGGVVDQSSYVLQDQILHRGQRSGVLHRQGNGFEQTVERKQWKRKSWTNYSTTRVLLDPAPSPPPSCTFFPHFQLAIHHIVQQWRWRWRWRWWGCFVTYSE